MVTVLVGLDKCWAAPSQAAKAHVIIFGWCGDAVTSTQSIYPQYVQRGQSAVHTGPLTQDEVRMGANQDKQHRTYVVGHQATLFTLEINTTESQTG